MRIESGQTVLLTGASGGLGAYIARAFAKRKTNLALTAYPGSSLEDVRAEAEKLGARAKIFTLDLRDPTGRTVMTFGSEFHGRLGLARTEVALDPAGPLTELGFGPAFISLWGRDVTGVLGGLPGREARTIPVG